MLLLTSTSDLVQIITGSTGTVEVHASWMDNLSGTITPGRTNTPVISTATTTTVVAAPAASTQRNVKKLSIRNDHASTSNLIEVQHTDGTNVATLWKGTLLAGEMVKLNAGGDWIYYDANGSVKPATAKFEAWLYVTADVTNATTSFADVTDLTCPLKSGQKYAFEAHLIHKGNATTNGARFGINGGTPTYMRVTQFAVYTPGATAAAIAAGVASAVDTAGAAETTGPGTTETIGIISGFIQPAADVTFAIRCAAEVAVAGGLVILKGSWLHIREVDN